MTPEQYAKADLLGVHIVQNEHIVYVCRKKDGKYHRMPSVCLDPWAQIMGDKLVFRDVESALTHTALFSDSPRFVWE